MSIQPPQTPTKEQLKQLVNAPSSQQLQSLPSTESNEVKKPQNLLQPGELDLKKLRSVRPISARAVPKAIFAAALLSPIFLIAYVFVNGIKLPSSDPLAIAPSSTRTEESAATDENTELRRQLDNANARLALIQRQDRQAITPLKQSPKQSKSAASDRAISKKAAIPVAVQVPRISAPRPMRVNRRVTRSVFPKPLLKAAPPVKQIPSVDPNEYLKQLARADVYGTAAPESDEEISSPALASSPEALSPKASSRVENTAYSAEEMAASVPGSLSHSSFQPIQAISPTPLSSNSASFSTLSPDRQLETPFLQGQTQHFLKVGTAARAVIATPVVLGNSGEQVPETVTVVLAEPLLGRDRSIVFPSGTQIVAQPRSLSTESIVQLVGVVAYIEKDNTIEKLQLPESAIEAITVVGTQQKQARHRRRSSSILWSVARQAANSTVTREIIDGNGILSDFTQEATDAAVNELERKASRAELHEIPEAEQYLAAGTPAKVYVKTPFSITAKAELSTTLPLTPLYPQLKLTNKFSLQREVALQRLRSRLRSSDRESD